MKAKVTSLRAARFTTRPPMHAIRNAKKAAFPHWPGETQSGAPISIIDTRPMLVGLKMCLPFHRTTNLLATATTAVAAAVASEFVLSRRQSDRAEISALLGS